MSNEQDPRCYIFAEDAYYCTDEKQDEGQTPSEPPIDDHKIVRSTT